MQTMRRSQNSARSRPALALAATRRSCRATQVVPRACTLFWGLSQAANWPNSRISAAGAQGAFSRGNQAGAQKERAPSASAQVSDGAREIKVPLIDKRQSLKQRSMEGKKPFRGGQGWATRFASARRCGMFARSLHVRS